MAQRFGFARGQVQTPKEAYSLKYNSARSNILLVILLTVVNIGMLLFDGNTYFLFSAFVPYFLVGTGMLMTGRMPVGEGEDAVEMPVLDDSFFWIMTAVAVVMVVLYLLSWLLSKDHKVGWLIFALVFFSADTLIMLLLGTLDVSTLVDIAFHIWVLVSLSMGLYAHHKWKTLPDEVPVPAYTFEQPLDENGMPVSEEDAMNGHATEALIDSPVLRYADETVKHRVLLEAEVDGLKIVYRRVKKVNELVVNGRVYDEYEALVEMAHELNAVVGGHVIVVGLDSGSSRSYAIVDGQQVATKLRIV